MGIDLWLSPLRAVEMKKKLAIIGASDFQNPLILKAKEMGYETHVFAWQCGDIGEKTADYFYPVSITEQEQILEMCREIAPDGVTTIGSDLGMVTAVYVANGLGLPANSIECEYRASNKYAMRQCFKEHGVSVPEFYVTDGQMNMEQIRQMSFPVIVKPTDRSGSRAITKVIRAEELKDAVEAACRVSFEKRAIVEGLIEGKEYSCECISYKGEHKALAITEKMTTGEPHYIETGHIEPAEFSSLTMKMSVLEEVFKALDALGVQYGASHTEFRVSESGKVGIIEIGARMGGDCIGSHLVPLSTGHDFMKMVIHTAVGEKPDMNRISEGGVSRIQFLLKDEDYRKFQKVQKEHPECIKEVSHIDLDLSKPVVDSSSRYGFYIMKFRDKREMEGIFHDGEKQ